MTLSKQQPDKALKNTAEMLNRKEGVPFDTPSFYVYKRGATRVPLPLTDALQPFSRYIHL